MLGVGGLMKHILSSFAAIKAVEIAGKTDTITNIINHAAKKAEDVADFLEEVVEDLEEEEDDLSM